MKKAAQILLAILIALLLLAGLFSLLIRYSSIQNYLVQRTVSILSERTNAVVKIGSFNWNMFDDISLNNFYLGKKNGDTLIYASKLFIDVNNWSYLKKRLLVNSVGLENAKINLEVIEDGTMDLMSLFKQSTTTDTTKLKSNKPFDWYTELQKVSVNNTTFKLKDKKNKTVIFTHFEDFLITLKSLDLAKKRIELNSIHISKPFASFIQYDSTPKREDTARFAFMPKGWKVSWNEIELTQGQFLFDKSFRPLKEKGIDFNHLMASNIDLKTEKGFVNSDSVETKITKLNVSEKSGVKVLSSNGNLLVSLQEVHYSDFSLKTENSVLTDQFAMHYTRFDDFKDFLEKVNLQANLKNSKLAIKDLSYFIKGMDLYEHNIISVSGKIKGRINNLDAKDLVLKTGNNTVISGTFYTSGLPKLQETFLNIRLKSLHTTIQDVRRFAPFAKIPDNLNKLENIDFAGNLDGFLTDFVAKGSLKTGIGSAASDLNFKYNLKTNESAYAGNLNLQQFDLGKWFNDTTIGSVSFIAKLNGKGLKIESLDSKIEGEIAEFSYRNYAYKNILVNGRVKGKSFEGSLSITDPNADLAFSGKADLTAAIPTFKFNSLIKNISLKDLNITKQDYKFQGVVNADFKGKNIDDLDGNLTITDLQITNDENIQTLRNISLKAEGIGNGKRRLVFETDMAEGNVTGDYSLAVLPKVLKSYFDKTVYRIQDTTHFKKQHFTYDFRIYDSFPILSIIDPKIKKVRNSFIKGSINTAQEKIELEGSIPEFVYDNYKVKTTNLHLHLDGKETDVTLNADKIFVSDSLYLDTVAIALTNSGQGYLINTQLKDAKNYNRLNTDLLVNPGYSAVDIQFQKTSIWLGGKEWRTSPNNNIHLSKNNLVIQDLFFQSGDQQILAESYKKADSLSCLKVTLKETSLNGFMAIFNTKVKDIDATVNGTLNIERIFAKPIYLADLGFKNIQLGKIKLGNLEVQSSLNEKLNRIDIAGILDGDTNKINIDGFYSLDKLNQKLDITANIKNAQLGFLNYPFFIKYVKEVDGTFNGKIHLAGPLKALDLDGNIHINSANVKVSFLNTKYSLKNEDIILSKEGYIDIGELAITDEKNNNANGYGKIYHDHLKRFRLDLNVNAQNAMFLNTTPKDNPTFYGQIFGTGRVTFTGVIPIIDIRAYARVNTGTHCYIPINSTFETNRYSFYKFVNKQADSLKALGKREQIKPSGVNFTVEVDVNPDAVMDIILDPSSGDILSSRGRGNLKIEILRTGEFSIYGLYEIDRGSYLFTLQNIINKRFQLNKGGTINFTGDIYKAQLNADAVYNVRTSTYDLIYDPSQTVSNLSEEATARAKNRITTKLLLKLNGALERPDIGFDITPQDVDPIIRTQVENKMQIVRSTESELNKQVFGLLVMNRFLPTNSTTSNAISNPNYISGGVTNTVSEFITSQFSMYVSNFFENMNVKDFDVNLNFRQYDQQSTITSTSTSTLDQYDTRRELQLALTKRFFNNRLSVNVGGNVDFGDRYAYDNTGTLKNNRNTNVNGDFQIEYGLTKSGNLRAKVFNKGDYDNFNQRNRNKTGVGLSFRQDFDNFKDLFRRRSRPAKPQKVETKPVAKPEETPTAAPIKQN